MYKFNIKICNIVFEINTEFADTYKLCGNYLTDEKASYVITIEPADIELEFERSDRKNYPKGYLETLAVYRKICEIMPSYSSFLIHGAAIGVGDNAFLFTAKSGVGKTTHIKLWLENIEGAYIINGDKPILTARNGEFLIYGTPWSGKEGLNQNISKKLKAVIFVNRAEENSIVEISAEKAFPRLYAQSYKPLKPAEQIKTLQLVGDLANNVKFYDLYCNMEKDAAICAANELLKNT